MRGSRILFSALLASAARSSVGRAEGEPSLTDLEIGWIAPPGCPDDRTLRDAIAALVPNATALAPGSQDLAFRGTVTHEHDQWVLRAESGRRASPRTKTIEAESCGALSEAFALIVAFAIDPAARANVLATNDLGESGPAATTVGPAFVASSDHREAPSPAPETPAPIQGAASTGAFAVSFGPLAAAGVGVLPSAAVGVGAAVAAGTHVGPEESGARLRLELAGLVWPRQTAMLDGSLEGLGVKVSLAELEPSACLSFGHSFAGACLGAGVGAMRATGVVASPAARTSWWVAITAGGTAEVAFSRHFGLRARLDAGVPLVTPTFALEQVGPPDPVQVFKPAPVFGVLRLEPEIRFSATDSSQAGH